MAEEMTVMDEWRAFDSLKRLKYRYARALDNKDWAGLRACFTDDLQFEVPSTGPQQGPDAAVDTLQSNFIAFAFTLHECSMPDLKLLNTNEAEGTWDIHTLTITTDAMRQTVPEKVHGYGRYLERYRKVGGEWRIAKLTLVRRFKDHQPYLS